MRFENKITVELNETDAAIASVLLAETAVRLALDALLADAYINVGQALSFAIMDAKKNRGVESTMTLVRSSALAGAAAAASDEAGTATEEGK